MYASLADPGQGYPYFVELDDNIHADKAPNKDDRCYMTVSWDNVANTVTVEAYDLNGNSTPLGGRTANLTNDVDITGVEFYVGGFPGGNGSGMWFGNEGITFTSTPEPATMLLLAAGGVLLRRRKK